MDVREDIENTSEESDLNSDAPIVEESQDEDDSEDVDYKALYQQEAEARQKAEDVAKSQKIRAEKAERGQKAEKAAPTAENKNELSQMDMLAIIRSNVPDEDIAEVTDYAKLKGMSVAEALKTPTVKAILSERAEVRQSASAASTGPTRRGTSKVSDETLIRNAEKGVMPESDADIERLIEARLQAYKK